MKSCNTHTSTRCRLQELAVAGTLAMGTMTGLALLPGCGGTTQKDLSEAGFDRNPVGVPPEAKRVGYQAGKGTGVFDPNSWFGADNSTFKPASDGRVWVVDELNARIVFQTKMKANDELVINTKDNAIRLNKAFVYGRPLPNERGFLIYYAPDTGQ